MKVSAYFAQGKRNEWEFSRCPCLNSFFSKLTYARTLKWTLQVKNEHIPQSILFTFYGGKNSILWRGPLGICHHCDKGNILWNKYPVTQSWTRIPIKIEFHEFPIKEFHLFNFLRYALKGPKSSNTRI